MNRRRFLTHLAKVPLAVGGTLALDASTAEARSASVPSQDALQASASTTACASAS